MLSIRRFTSALLLAGLVVLFIAGCGGGESEPTNTPTATSASATGTPAQTAQPTQAATATSETPQVQGFVTVAGTVPPPIFQVSRSGQGYADALLTRYGVYESFLRAEYCAPPDFCPLGSEGIGTSWTIAPDQSKITFEIQPGVKFHGGYGEVTAEDVAFSMNDAWKEGSLFTRASRDIGWADRAEAVDEMTLDLHIKVLDPQWMYYLSNQGDTTLPIVSLAAFEQLGEEAFNTTDAGTGPFLVDDWDSGNALEVTQNPEYWRDPAKVERIRYVFIPEPSTLQAAMNSNEVDIAQLQLPFVNETVESIGGRSQQIGVFGSSDINMAGNYWADVDRDTGNTVFPRQGFQPDGDHPWIGDPNDAESMERAQKVRLAMALALDRELLVERLTDNLGSPSYTLMPVSPGAEQWKEEWMIPYDPDRAEALLEEAGYSDGFRVELCACQTGGGTTDLAEAIGQMWTNIGIVTTIDRTDYEINRTKIVDRTMEHPWIWGWNYGQVDEPIGIWLRPSAGFSRGVELPDEISDLTYANFEEQDVATRIANNVQLQDWLSEWMVVVPVYKTPTLFVVSPRVKEWTPHQSKFSFFNSPETIVVD